MLKKSKKHAKKIEHAQSLKSKKRASSFLFVLARSW